MIHRIAIDSDNLVEVDGVYNEATSAYVNDATVTMTLRDEDFEVVTDAEDLLISYVTDSDGKYQGVLPSTLSLTPGNNYYLDVSTDADGVQDFDRLVCRAEYAKGLNS